MKFKTLIMVSLGFSITACEKEEAKPANPTFDLTTIYPYHGFEGHRL